ncbi:DoxX family protein [Pseudolysinimonas sp.]|uniref:DoxX family protein n=1 Tax=Pseudolysinimonas sp. TaxID=2680009 RepID=UPI00286A1062|nr:DoxX family protein [Pseudolysinimonas sp.]
MDALHTAQLALRIALAAVFAFMGVLHFVPAGARAMRAMIPPPLRRPGWPTALVAITGVCELLGAVGLLVPWDGVRLAAGICLVVFLVAVFPANAYAARDPDRFGRIAIPFLPRLIAQVLLAALVILAAWPLA